MAQMQRRWEMAMILRIFLVMMAAGLVVDASAKEVVIRLDGQPRYADGEVSVCVPFGSRRMTMRICEVTVERIDPNGRSCVLVAFGRDADGDGVLAPSETVLVVGHQGPYVFIEKVDCWLHFVGSERIAPGSSFKFKVATDWYQRPDLAYFENACVHIDLLDSVRPWMCTRDWNIMKIIHRGAVAASEVITCKTLCYGGMMYCK